MRHRNSDLNRWAILLALNLPTILLADLGLEKNPNSEQGLVVWAWLVTAFACFGLALALRRGGILKPHDTTKSEDEGTRGSPFMRRTARNVCQLLLVFLSMYALARFVTPRLEKPSGWSLISPPHEVTTVTLQGNIIWAGGKEGLFAVDRRTSKALDIPAIRARDVRAVRALIVDGDALWIGCGKGLFRYVSGIMEETRPPKEPDLGPVTALCLQSDRTLWVGVRGGAWRVGLENGEWKWFGVGGVSSVTLIRQDQKGVLWFGSDDPENGRLFSMKPPEGQLQNRSAGLTSRAMNDLAEDEQGVLWMAAGFGSRGGAARLVGQSWSMQAVPGLEGQKIRSLFHDSHGRLWFCSEYDGVAIRRNSSWRRLTMKDGLPGSEIKDMLEDENGTYWLATERGLGCLRTEPWPETAN